jgi:cytochrome c-type biogenesis protein CcmH
MRLALAALALMLIGATPATAAPEASLLDLEDEVMCPVCGTLLELAEAPQAQQQRAYITGLIAQGKTKDEIKDRLVAEYGREVLALPRGSGFSLTAYLVPIAGLALAVGLLGFGVARWRRAASEEKEDRRGGAPRRQAGDDDARLDADIARYDL